MRHTWRIALTLAAIVMAAGCAGNRSDLRDTPPAWVADPLAAFPEDQGKVLYAVGECSDVRHPAMKAVVVRDRARKKMAGTIEEHVAALAKGLCKEPFKYFDSIEDAAFKQFVETVGEQVSSATIRDATEVKRWVSREGAAYSLYKLKLDDRFMNVVKAKMGANIKPKSGHPNPLTDLEEYLQAQCK